MAPIANLAICPGSSNRVERHDAEARLHFLQRLQQEPLVLTHRPHKTLSVCQEAVICQLDGERNLRIPRATVARIQRMIFLIRYDIGSSSAPAFFDEVLNHL